MKAKNLKTAIAAKVYNSFEQWEKENLPNKVRLEDLSFKNESENDISDSNNMVDDKSSQLMLA